MSTIVKYAKLDPALTIASLIRPITRGRRPRALELITQYNGLTLTWRTFEWLDCRDQSVLYACAGLALIEKGGVIHANTNGSVGRQLWLDLEPYEKAEKDSAIAFDTSYYRILEEAGMDNNQASYERLKDILNRLSDVSIRAQSEDGYDWKMRLISFAARPDGRISIALNSRMAAALHGQHVSQNLVERRQLKADVAQIAHGWLSSWARNGKESVIYVDTLASNIWGCDSKNNDTQRQRRKRTISALNEINELEGWQINIAGMGKKTKATINRVKCI